MWTAVLAALLVVAALGLAGCGGQPAASSGSGDASVSGESETSEAAADASAYFLRFNGSVYLDVCYAPGEPLTLKAAVDVINPGDSDPALANATFEWTVDEKLGATVNGDTLTIPAMPESGTYEFSVKAKDTSGKELVAETHEIPVKAAPEPRMVVVKESDGTPVDTAKAKADSVLVQLEGMSMEWLFGEGRSLSWQVKDVKSGTVYDENTGLLDNDAKANGGIQAESDLVQEWPTMKATFDEPGDYEITATFTLANGSTTIAQQVLHVE